jgi:hypothetical protein
MEFVPTVKTWKYFLQMGRRTVVASGSAVLRITILSLGVTLGLPLSMLDLNVKLILL